MSSVPMVPNNTGDDFPMFARIHDVPPGTDAPADTGDSAGDSCAGSAADYDSGSSSDVSTDSGSDSGTDFGFSTDFGGSSTD